MKKHLFLFVSIILGSMFSTVYALDIYVSPNGSDSNRGTKNRPLATFVAAQKKARAFAGKESVTIYFADGVYYLPETIVFDPDDSGTEKHPILYRAQNEGGAVLSGGMKLELTWKPYKDGVFKAKTPKGIVIDQVFVDGLNQRMARYPNYDASKKTDAYQGYAADAFSKERAARWKNPKGGYIHAMHSKRWGGYHYIITGKNPDGEVTYEGGWQNNRQMGMHPEYRMVENIFEELDAPGEWFHDESTQTLYYMPEDVTDLNKAKVEVVRLKQLIDFQGSMDHPIKHISLQGFIVRHAART
ncbi:peptide-binding protein, partial [Zobellia sp.]|nr:peptide-binding protein [Zobellia sp.]